MPFFRVSFFSIISWTGYENWLEIPKQVITTCSRTIDYCFPYCFWIFLWSNNSETGYQNANFFPKWVVEILNKWAPPRQVTFKCPPGGLLYKLFTELGVGGRMRLAIKDLDTGIKAQVLCSGSLFRQFSVSQGTGQGRILALFKYKTYINALLIALSDHAYALNINKLSLSSQSFADDFSLLAIQPPFLRVLVQMCFCYSLNWRYEFNNSKSGVTFGENMVVHCDSMKRREWILGGEIVDEFYEYKNLGVRKNYMGFTSKVDDNIE